MSLPKIRGKQATIKINRNLTFRFLHKKCVECSGHLDFQREKHYFGKIITIQAWKDWQKRKWGHSWTHFPPGLFHLHSSFSRWNPSETEGFMRVHFTRWHSCLHVNWSMTTPDFICQVRDLVGETTAGTSFTNGEIRRADRGEERLVKGQIPVMAINCSPDG